MLLNRLDLWVFKDTVNYTSSGENLFSNEVGETSPPAWVLDKREAGK